MKKRSFLVLPVCMLALGLVLAGCSQDSSDPLPPSTDSTDQYRLEWGTTYTSIPQVLKVITDHNWTLTAGDGRTWVLGSGQVAKDVYNWCKTGNNVTWLDGGVFDGTFEECINFTNGGVGAPAALKTAASNHKADVPLSCIYDYNGQFAVLCYITKK